MGKIVAITCFLILVYLLMVGWNVAMYRQFPMLVVTNYWFFVGMIAIGYFILKGTKAIR